MTAIPPLVAAAALPAAMRERLIAALERVGAEPALTDVRAALLLEGFTRAAEAPYAALAAHARRVDATGYARLQ